MALTPLDIQNKVFSNKMRGFDRDEVLDFLDLVARDYEIAVQKNRELEKSLKHAEEKLAYFNELKDALNQSIIVAQDTADKVKSSATKESEVLVTSAQNKANELVADAEKRAFQITQAAEDKAKEILSDATQNARQLVLETNDLKKKTRVFYNSLLLKIETQLQEVKSPEWDDILAPFSTYVPDSSTVLKEVLEQTLDNEADVEVNSQLEVSNQEDDETDSSLTE